MPDDSAEQTARIREVSHLIATSRKRRGFDCNAPGVISVKSPPSKRPAFSSFQSIEAGRKSLEASFAGINFDNFDAKKEWKATNKFPLDIL